MWPEDGGGEVKVVLTEECCSVLEKIPEMRRWQVQPTMTRGAKAAAKKLEIKAVKPKSKPGPLKPAVKKHRIKEKKLKPVITCQDSVEITASMFRRTPQGRERIKMTMEDLLKLDQKAFPKCPVFDEEGTCRMKFQGSDRFNWAGVLDNAGSAFEHMRPDLYSRLSLRNVWAFCRYNRCDQPFCSIQIFGLATFALLGQLIYRFFCRYEEHDQSFCSLLDLLSPSHCIIWFSMVFPFV